MVGYIYIRCHPAYDIHNACLLSKTTNMTERDYELVSNEFRRGHYNMIIEVPIKKLNIISGIHSGIVGPDMYWTDWKEAEYTPISKNLKPSGEIPMHFALQKEINTDTRVVLHLHPTYTTAAMYKGIDLTTLSDQFPELSRYTKVGKTVPAFLPLTQELADACVRNLGLELDGSLEYNIVGMDRHGVVAVDTSPWRAFEHIERLEHICKIILHGAT